MTPAERAERLAELVESALELDPESWPAYLEEACAGDDDLRAEVESLLGYRAQATDFIETPAYQTNADVFADDEFRQLKAGERIGDYEILSLLGEGGMGDVYLARDAELGRTVAIKLVKQGFGRGPLVRQFQHEARILAGLNHPHIARLYGTGIAPAGAPFFVMEYVEGERLEEYCAKRHLSIADRLALFRKLCSAVACAHQHLIIHHDLKPANIRVTPEGEPKLLDFGIARLLDDEAALAAEQPVALAGVMTPEYASPEQVRGEIITTASDVYSLGVILYQLLAGKKPYRITSRKPEEIARTITQHAPPPSVAVAGQPSELSSPKILRGDLDAIVLMAMHREPSQRYTSATELSQDIQRHLARLPIAARKDTWGYRAGKFVARHKVGVAAGILVTLTLVGGIVATMRQARRADRQRAHAERRFQDVRNLANSLMFDLHDAIEHLPGSTPARELIVKEALQYLDSLAQEASDDPSLQRDLVRAYIRVGNVQGAPSNPNLGDTAGALRSYAHAREIAEDLIARDEDDREARRSLGVVKEKIGDLRAVGGDLAGAVANTRASLEIFHSLAEAAPDRTRAQRSLAISHIKLGDVLGNPNLPNNKDPAGAMEHYRHALTILAALDHEEPQDLRTRRFLGLIHERIGTIQEAQDEMAAADESYRRSQQIRAALAREHSDNAALVRDAAIAEEKMGNVQAAAGDLPGALQSRERSLEIFQRLVSQDPQDVQSQLSLAISHLHLADLLGGQGRPNLGRQDAAMENYRRAVEILTPLAEKNDPPDRRAREYLAEAREKLGQLQAAP